MALGTRSNSLHINAEPSASMTRKEYNNPGMAKLASAVAITFANTGTVSAANGTFSNFVAGDPVNFHGTNSNNGEFLITAIDATNGAYIVVSPPPKAEGPVTCDARTE